MSEPKVKEEIALADKPFIVAGSGQTAKREGATTKDVYNVSFPKEPQKYSLLELILNSALLG